MLSHNLIDLKVFIITARKRSWGEGNVFTPVRDSVHRGKGFCPRESLEEGVFVQGFSGWSLSRRVASVQRVSLEGEGRGSLSRGGLYPGVSLSGRPLQTETPHMVKVRAVCILLECILVYQRFLVIICSDWTKEYKGKYCLFLSNIIQNNFLCIKGAVQTPENRKKIQVKIQVN